MYSTVLLGFHPGDGPADFTNPTGVFRGTSGTDFSMVLDKFHPEFVNLFNKFYIREL
jgi:hypothetical protein